MIDQILLSMDFKKQILKEHSKLNTYKVADYVGDNKERFKALVDVCLTDDVRSAQRGFWVIGICTQRFPSLITPHLKRVLDYLNHQGIHNAVKRNAIRLLQFCEIPKRFEGRVVSLCFEYLQQKTEPVAVKVFSMAVLSKIIAHQPELKNELRIILEDQLPYSSAAFISRARKILRQIARIQRDTSS